MTTQLVLPFSWHSGFHEDSFIQGASNGEAFSWIHHWPWQGHHTCVFGPAGCGKTHLAAIWARQHGSIRLSDFPTRVEKRQTYVLDDFLVQGKDKTLFTFFNDIVEKQSFCLWIARKPPREWSLVLPDIRSRLLSIPAISIGMPDEKMLFQVLKKCLKDRNLLLPESAYAFLLKRMPRSFQSIQPIVHGLDELSSREKKPVSCSLVKKVVHRLEQKEFLSLETR